MTSLTFQRKTALCAHTMRAHSAGLPAETVEIGSLDLDFTEDKMINDPILKRNLFGFLTNFTKQIEITNMLEQKCVFISKPKRCKLNLQKQQQKGSSSESWFVFQGVKTYFLLFIWPCKYDYYNESYLISQLECKISLFLSWKTYKNKFLHISFQKLKLGFKKIMSQMLVKEHLCN